MMGITTEEYRRYISDLDALKSGKALKNNYQKEQVTLTARKKQLIKQLKMLKTEEMKLSKVLLQRMQYKVHNSLSEKNS